MKNLTWQNPEQLFVAQELINKVKSKCCGIKGDEDSKSMLPFLKVGWNNLFSAKICLKNDVDSEDKRIKIVIYLVSKMK